MKNVKKVKFNEINWKKFNINTILGLYMQYKEVINYLIFGGLTTVVNIISYYIFSKLIGLDEIVSSGLSWFFAVLFAYITNKIFVFESKTNKFIDFVKEIVSFFLARVLSGALCDVGTFAIMVRVLRINDIVSKIITQVMVIVLNYVLSKWIIFKKKSNSK